MFKKFWQAIVVGILEIILVVLTYLLVNKLIGLSINYVYTVMIVTLVAYIVYLITVLDAYEKYKKKQIEKKKGTGVSVTVKTTPIVLKKEIKEEIKPKVIEKIVNIPSGDLSFVELKDYIKYNLYYGRNANRIKQNLLEVGWSKEEIDRAFDAVGDVKPINYIDGKDVEDKVKENLRREILRLKKEVEDLKGKPGVVKVSKPVVVTLLKEKRLSKKYRHLFVGSKDGGKYHKYNCSWGNNIEKKKERFFRTHKEAQEKGYGACRVCIGGKWVKPKPVKEKLSKKYTHRFVASRDGGKYHTYNCHWGDAIEDKKQRFFKTKYQAQRAGYSACGSCIKK